jgi:hypothetical protein
MSKKSKNKHQEEEEKRSKSKKKDKDKGKRKEKKSDKKGKAASSVISAESRREMIATAAYYIAERHGFTPGESQADWRAAEKEIDAQLKQKGKKKAKG